MAQINPAGGVLKDVSFTEILSIDMACTPPFLSKFLMSE
jgi:hypothetical protein